ncbi:MAG: tRNA (adenosine(37)-N6)-threonylcarbamoyltransferase complex dimerization subunit type 1 TsaB [Clostridia bacterium]|nr:tRNA (adenosine(37)-N6)-threonylcarbamoyltransferase complex dimerization subunit type 1 TsaB [Clostridia bacterium]
MKILSIDTSNEICSVAILEDNRLIRESKSTDMKQHSVTLMPMIKTTLEAEKIDLKDINVIGCGIGPGSFTGVRIAISTAKAFSDVNNTPVVGVNSLEAQAYGVIMKKGYENCKIVSLIDARNENVFVAVYRVNKERLSIYKNPEFINVSKITDFFDFDEPIYIVGNINKKIIEPFIQAKIAKEQAQAKDVKQYEYIKNEVDSLANAIGQASLEKFKMGLYGDSSSISPMYLQKPQAERQKDGDDSLYICELGKSDLEEIKDDYEKFPNIWDYKTFETDSKNSKYFVAKLNNEIVGFIGYKTVFDEIEIMNIVTRIDKRKRGIASSLLSHIIRKIPANKINLEVNENNKIAKNLYTRFGFEQIGVRNKYYKDGSNAIVMSR